ncbi:unnamed protein product [Nippostrongylus brasiliensis]|uniref:26S proteasome non-ATPase regulatory subunit 10 (inferred by orthology to a human protein) n=1 Tax=Nippostrongylus brasiliensis TaxID=27835 RepID=A0A158R377_NIPBR|nr:unnamed protein product [Nippostrongylus brasiliensis]
MAPVADRAAMDAHLLQQEIVRLDTIVKQKIDGIVGSVLDERALHEETREIKDLLATLAEEASRSSLLEGGSSEMKLRQRKMDEKSLKDNAAKAAKRMITRCEAILNATDDSGRSTPHFAAVGGCLPILQLSISQDKEAANRTDDLGWTPLMIASSAGRVEIVRYLLSLPHVDVSHRNANQQTALHYAASKNHREVVHMLLARPKIHVDVRNSEGNTPLFLACEEGREDVAIALVRKGADLTLKNKASFLSLSAFSVNQCGRGCLFFS